MRQPLILCICLLFSCGSTSDAQPHVETAEQAIINGSRSPRSVGLEASEILAIGALVNYGSPEAAFCTGTAITNRVVLTAAHCIQNTNGVMRTAEDLAFVIGENPEIDGIIYDVAEVAIHPNYDYRSQERQIEDVAVVLLASDLSDQAPGLLPIEFNRHPLNGLDAAALLERRVEIAGYGKTETGSSLNIKKGRFFTSVELTRITDLTVVIDGQGATGACDGDSGGPVLALNMRQSPVLLGVLRGGSETCVGQDHYARVDPPHVREWIESYIMLTWPTYPEGSVCGNLSFFGRCVAGYVEYCDQNFSVVRQNCTTESIPKACSFLNLDSGYACRPTASCKNGICTSRFDGFLPPAPLSIQNVGGCTHTVTHSPTLFVLISMMLGLWVYRRRC